MVFRGRLEALPSPPPNHPAEGIRERREG